MRQHGVTTDRSTPPAVAWQGYLASGGRWGGHSGHRRSGHAAAALSAAVEDGLLSEEVDGILEGRSVLEAFPVRWDETPDAYAVRVVAEMMVAYLA